MAAHVKMLLEKKYPSLKGKVNTDESHPNIIDIIFFIQNSKRKIKKVVLKNNIENIVLEQQHDVLVLPSNIYSDETSMKKLKDFYEQFFEENQIERSKSIFEDNLRLQKIDQPNAFNMLFFKVRDCILHLDSKLKYHNSKDTEEEEFLNCSFDEILPSIFKEYQWLTNGVLNKKNVKDFDQKILLRVSTRILPWAIILEWVCSTESKTQRHIPIHFSPLLFKKIKFLYEK
ncbi:hypothetical protein HMI55_005624, partial [Coelomomyces lativittatus]